MDTTKKYGAFSSVDDPQQLSLMVASGVRLLATLAMSAATLKGMHLVISDEQVQSVADASVASIAGGIAIWHGAQLILGLFRKIVVTQ